MKRKAKRPAVKKKAARPKRAVMRHSREGVNRAAKRPAARKASRPKTSALKQQFLDRFVKEFPTTLKVILAFPSGKDSFKPDERSKSAVQLVHTFTIENGAAATILHGELQMPPSFPPAPATVAEAAAAYERGAQDLIEGVRAVRDSRLHETVAFFTGPGQMGPVPVIDVLWFMLLDSIHHRGQLSVYVRLAGGKVPSIYGPSADEPWR